MTNGLLKPERNAEIEQEVNKLLSGNSMDFNQMEVMLKIAKDEGIFLEEAELQDISGILYKDKDESWKIVVNKDDSSKRKLFTIAHELGHYFLHKDKHNKFVDSQFVQTCFGRSEMTKYQENEIEANEFAGSLIMPKAIIEKELGDVTVKDVNKALVAGLAQKLNVSSVAMETRLRNLGYGISE